MIDFPVLDSYLFLLSAGEDPCWAQPYLCMLQPPLSMVTSGGACMPNKEVIKMSIHQIQSDCFPAHCRFHIGLNSSRHAVLWFLPITQAEDGLNKCSLEPSWSLPWFVELPSSSTSSPSTTTPPELSHSAPWWVWHCDTSLKNHSYEEHPLSQPFTVYLCGSAALWEKWHHIKYQLCSWYK